VKGPANARLKDHSGSRTSTANNNMFKHLSKAAVSGALVLALSSTLASAQTVYRVDIVDGDNANDGFPDWSDAVQTLDHALSLATTATDQIWVHAHAGVPYRLTGPAASDTYRIDVDGIGIYGGFAGNELSLASRPNTLFTSTVLSGDILGNSGSGSPTAFDDDAYHVVTIDSAITELVLDGFLIEYGNASGSVTDALGGGVYFERAPHSYTQVTLRNLTVERCRAAEAGGGMYLYRVGGDPGADIAFSRVVVRDCLTFKAGSPVTGDGGGVFMEQCGPRFAWYNCIFDGNRSVQGGGLFVKGNNALVEWQNCLFLDNRALRGAGAGFDNGNAHQFSHCTFAYNEVTIPATATTGGGSAIYMESGGGVNMDSSIMWANTTKDFRPGPLPVLECVVFGVGSSPSNFSAQYSCTQVNVYPPGWFGTGSISVDPLFVNGAARDLRLQAGSPALDTADDGPLLLDLADLDGDNVTTMESTPLDLGEMPREVDIAGASGGIDAGNLTSGEITDMGAYERQ
jgi:hypothetical protein